MKIPILAAFLAFISTASPRIGETISEAITRLGPPNERLGTGGDAVYTWFKRDGAELTITVCFERNRSTSEKYYQWTRFSPAEVRKHLGKLSAAWNGEFDTLIDSVVGVWAKIEEETIFIGRADDELQKLQGNIADLKKQGAKLDVILADESARGIKRLVGKVMSKFEEGILVKTESGTQFDGLNVLLVGHPREGKTIDGIGVRARVKESGIFEYRSMSGGTHRIIKVNYDSEFPQ